MSSHHSGVLNQLVGQSPMAEQPTCTKTSNGQNSLTAGIMNHGASAIQPTFPTANQPPSATSTNQKPKGNICPRCAKPVYFAEEVKAVGQSFHKLCYKCANCKKSINGASFSEHDGNLYDDNCYKRLFGPKGVGFGIGAGALSTGN